MFRCTNQSKQTNRRIADEPKLKEECGVFAAFGISDAAQIANVGLHALQHRGQESAGITTFLDGHLQQHKGMGLAKQVFDPQSLQRLNGDRAIGHVRYSTTGESELKNAQPISGVTSKGKIALAHNGNLINSQELRRKLEREGIEFQTTVDTEVIYHLIDSVKNPSLEDALLETLNLLKGAFSLVVMTPDRIYGIRDPYGFRPLVLGKYGTGYILASETCALDQIGASYERDLQPGEMVCITEVGIRSVQYASASSSFCAFELIYFARPNSRVNGHDMYQLRRELGKMLAGQVSAKVDVVIPVPDSGIPAGLGVAEAMGILFQYGLVKNNYEGRTFILPESIDRSQKVRLKLNIIPEVVLGKRVLVVDDSIVRGTTSKVICQMLLEGGAKEVHLAISSPPVKYPCYYGIDISEPSKLIAGNFSFAEIQSSLNVSSLMYLKQEEMEKVFIGRGIRCCTACFDGEYRDLCQNPPTTISK